MNRPRPLRWGVLGTGRLLEKIVEAFRLVNDAALTAVASRDADRARATAARFSIPRAHPGYAALVADPDVDIVYNALHNGLHCEWTCRALAAGKHVLCEKPLACSSIEVDQMFAAAATHRRWLMEAFMYRFHPQMAAARRLVDGGAIGRILHIQSVRIALGRERTNPRYWPAAGGGALMDIGCYCVNFSRFFAGAEPHRVTAQAHLDPVTGVDLSFWGTLEFPHNPVAQFVCSFEGEPSYAAEIVGTEGRLLIPHPWLPPLWPAELVLTRHQQTETIPITAPATPRHALAPFVLELEHFAACVREQRAPAMVTEEDSRANMRVIEALRQAARA